MPLSIMVVGAFFFLFMNTLNVENDLKLFARTAKVSLNAYRLQRMIIILLLLYEVTRYLNVLSLMFCSARY